MGLVAKKSVNQTTSVQAPAQVAIDNSIVKAIDPDKVSMRMRKIVESYPDRYRRSIFAVMAAMVVDVPIAVYEENVTHDMLEMIRLFTGKVVVENKFDKMLIMRERSSTLKVSETIMSIMLPGLPPFSDADSLFKTPYPMPSETTIKYSSIKASVQFINKIEFADDAKAKFVEIATTLQSQLGDDFAPQKMYFMIPIVKTVAFINGHKKVQIEDLGILDCSWTKPSRRDEFVSVVDSIVSNFTGIAEQFRGKLAKIRTRFSQARAAVANNQLPNYWDTTIPSSWSLDDVIVNCINDTSEAEAELIALTDGKSPTNKAHAPLFAVYDEAKSMKKMFAQAKGVKV